MQKEFLEIPLNHIESGLVLTIYPEGNSEIREIDDLVAKEFSESKYQILEGNTYEYYFNKGNYQLSASILGIVIPSKKHTTSGRIVPNIYVGTLALDIINISRNLATRYRVILVLKDSRTIIALPNGEVFVNLSGNSALSVAGSGDILTGVIAAQFALGLSIEESARMGVFIHGLCGDLLKDSIGQDGVMAQDILNHLPKTLKYFRENYGTIKNKYDIEEV